MIGAATQHFVVTHRRDYAPYIVAVIMLTAGVLGWYVRRLIKASDDSRAAQAAATAKGMNDNTAAIAKVAGDMVHLQRQQMRAHFELAERVVRLEERTDRAKPA